MKICIRGNVLGRRLCSPMADIVQVPMVIEEGPAENAFVLVCCSGRARYLSWIGYYDVEYAIGQEPGNWKIVEPPEAFEKEVDWCPYGWDDAERVPTIGDVHINQHR